MVIDHKSHGYRAVGCCLGYNTRLSRIYGLLAATTLVKVHNLAGKNAMILGGYMHGYLATALHIFVPRTYHILSLTTCTHALLLVSNTRIQMMMSAI